MIISIVMKGKLISLIPVLIGYGCPVTVDPEVIDGIPSKESPDAVQVEYPQRDGLDESVDEEPNDAGQDISWIRGRYINDTCN